MGVAIPLAANCRLDPGRVVVGEVYIAADVKGALALTEAERVRRTQSILLLFFRFLALHIYRPLSRLLDRADEFKYAFVLQPDLGFRPIC